METKHPPSVIAKLMGIDELPPKRPVYKQQAVLSENYLRKTASIGLLERRSSYDRSFRASSEERNRSKEVVEVAEKSRIDKHKNVTAKSSSREAIVAYINQKFLEQDHLLMDEKLLQSKEFDDVLEELYHDKDPFLRHLHHPDTLSTKKLHDHSRKGGLTLLKPFSVSHYRKNELHRKSGSQNKRGIALRSLQKLETGNVTDSYEELGVESPYKFLKSQLEMRKVPSFSSSKIVVLKPNYGALENGANSSFSPSSHKGSELHNTEQKEFINIQNGELCVDGSSAKEANNRFSGRLISIKRPHKVGMNSKVRTLGEMLAMPDQDKMQRDLSNKLHKHGHSNKSNINKYDEDLGSPFGISSRDGWKEEPGRNVQRSLALPAACITDQSPEFGKRSEAGHGTLYLEFEHDLSWGKIKSRERKLTQHDRSKSGEAKLSNEISESCACLVSESSGTTQDIYAVLEEMESMAACRDSSLGLETDHTVQATQVIQGELKRSFRENEQYENHDHNVLMPDISVSDAQSASPISALSSTESENVGLSFGSYEKQDSEPVARVLFDKDVYSSPHILEASTRQESSVIFPEEALIHKNCHKIYPEVRMSVPTGYLSSPSSVLEAPFTEEVSLSECFDSVGTDLHDLRAQLQLLSSESEEAYSEGSDEMVVSSDDDCGEGYANLSRESKNLLGLFRAEESRDFSYLVDVLDEAGFQNGNLQIASYGKWHSPECPISLSVFETLEKKFGEQVSWSKSERRLLFDRINTGLMEIFLPSMDMQTWAKPLRWRLNFLWSRELIEEELWMWLVGQEKEVSKDLCEESLGGEFRLFELGDSVDVLGMEIESFLFDELVAELVSEH